MTVRRGTFERAVREVNWNLATPAEILEEADRRARNRMAGRNPTDDGPPTTPAAAATEHARRLGPDRLFLAQQPSFEGALFADLRTELVLCLPWSHLLADNRKYAPALTKQRKATMILTADYRTAKRRAVNTLTVQMGGAPPFKGPVEVVARLWEPDRQRRRDLTNLAKLVQDAMNGIAYTDDSMIDDVRWIRAGVDVDRPRLDLTITPRKLQ